MTPKQTYEKAERKAANAHSTAVAMCNDRAWAVAARAAKAAGKAYQVWMEIEGNDSQITRSRAGENLPHNTGSKKMESQKTVQAYMTTIVTEHTDLLTGEVYPTALAEDACQHFDDYGPAPEYDIPEDYFEWAFQISEI